MPNLARMALLAHNQWLEAILADSSPSFPVRRRGDPKQAGLAEGRVLGGWSAPRTPEPFTLDPSSVCNRLFPVYGTVRIAAGAPVAADILKCSLKSIDFKKYAAW